VLQARPLSSKDPDDPEYDHDAFVGEEEAEAFESLDPEESQRRLGVIVDRIDAMGDGDGLVSVTELQRWIRYIQEREVMEDTERQWQERSGGGDERDQPVDRISWKAYKNDVYGFEEEEDGSQHSGFSFEPMMDRDLRRWTAADSDGDMNLNKLEFQAFLHPEETEHMRDVMVLETMEDMDKDGDGMLSLEEYIGDLYGGQEGEEEPDWVTEEKNTFSRQRDRDGDGFMNVDEVKNWIVPHDFDHTLAEAKHLMDKADTSDDKMLSKEEILQQYDMFVGSSATQWGEALGRHDEF